MKDKTLDKIIDNIEFRLFDINDPGEMRDHHMDAYLNATALDVTNTVIHDKNCSLWNMSFLSTPRYSTIANAYIINKLVEQMPKNQVYLNVGIFAGWSFFAGMIGQEDKKVLGVDNFSCEYALRTKPIFEHLYEQFKTKNSVFIEEDYLEYFKTHKEKIGVYFFDGPHDYNNQYKAMEIAHPYLAKNSYMIIDDTNWDDPYNATMDFVKKNKEYKVVFDQKTPNNMHPTYWNGWLILKKTKHKDLK